jgi:hypothetical protein
MHLPLSYTQCKGAAHTSNFNPTTSNSNIEKRVILKKFYSTYSQDLRGKKKVGGDERRGEEEMTNNFLLYHRKIFRGTPLKRERNGKTMVRTG